jgi:hypothetical protein
MVASKLPLILSLVGQGKTTREICDLVGLTRSGVRYYREKSKRKYAGVRNKYGKARILQLKKRAVSYSGGRCLRCHYDICLPCLVFHHMNPNNKELNLSQAWRYNLNTVKREVDKTVLLCNRCHGELHNSIWSLDEKMILEQINIRKGGSF